MLEALSSIMDFYIRSWYTGVKAKAALFELSRSSVLVVITWLWSIGSIPLCQLSSRGSYLGRWGWNYQKSVLVVGIFFCTVVVDSFVSYFSYLVIDGLCLGFVRYCYECINKATGQRHCLVCGQLSKNMCICDQCPRAYHIECLNPPLAKVGSRWIYDDLLLPSSAHFKDGTNSFTSCRMFPSTLFRVQYQNFKSPVDL